MSKDQHSSHPTDPEASAHKGHEDDVVVVPKGSSKVRFLMTVLLAFLVLTTFTVSKEVQDFFTGGNQGKNAYMSWKRPDGTIEQIKDRDFMLVKQELARVESILSGGRSTPDHDDVHTARHIILDELAKEAGVEVTDDELRAVILPRVGNSKETYELMLDRYRTSSKQFEGTLRAMLRVERYESLLAGAFGAPDADEVVAQWKKSHREFSVETVELETEPYTREATEACPTGDALKAWFDALPDPEKAPLRPQLEAKTSAEVAWFNFDPPTKTERLLEKYPRPAEEKPEEVAKTWYDANKKILYLKPGLPAGKVPAPEDYLSFEEVHDKAQAQGVVYQSILDWVNDMKAKELRGEAVGFVDEATTIGCGYRNELTPHSRAEWRQAAMAWSGNGFVDALFAPTSEAGKVIPDAIVDANGVFVGRLTTKVAPHAAEFADIQEKVHDAWITKKKGELALAKLESLRAKLPTQPDENDPENPMTVETDAAKFQGAAQELGLTITPHDWFDVGARLTLGSTIADITFMRQLAARYGTVVGAVSKPEMTPDKSKARLARIVGSRDPDPARMTPLDFQNARQFAAYTSARNFSETTFGSDEYLKDHFALDLQAWRSESSEKRAAKTN